MSRSDLRAAHHAAVNRRAFLNALLGAGAALAAPPWAPRRAFAALPPEDALTVSILHTTDLHGRVLGDSVRGYGADVGGFARCAAQIRRWRRENPNTILLDLGDLYQGTDAGWRSEGRLMTDCLNALDYDAWSLGNHEFDWGLEPVHDALRHCRAPAIGTNLLLEGRNPEDFDAGADHPLSKILPWKIMDVGGVRIGLLGFTTPGMPYWFPDSFYEGMTFLDCADPARRAEAALRAAGVDAVVLFGHMGLRPEGDNQSNQVRAVMQACPRAAAYIGAHSHRLHLDDRVGDVVYTQAHFWGSHLGRLDLTFDRASGRLVSRRTEMAFLGPDAPMDPVVLDLCRDRLDESAAALAQPVGRLAETLGIESAPGAPSDVERLIGAAVTEGMAQRAVRVDGVIHGVFARSTFEAGEKTVTDMWRIIPFENFTLTAQLTPAQIAAILNECYARSERNLMGMRAQVRREGEGAAVERILLPGGVPADPGRRYTVAFNTWDAQSGGGRLRRTREILREPESRAEVHRVQTRQSLIEFFLRHETVGRAHLAAAHERAPRAVVGAA
ncbi:MAG: bifunctional metallophosphatase/5'-nucleotidase [Phycisphaerales bacterium]|nr:MAG: bifunctional metallophosphatase/5'-nucleotidase [Phycisphaerales bacterium]